MANLDDIRSIVSELNNQKFAYGRSVTNIGGNTNTGLLENAFGRNYSNMRSEFNQEYRRSMDEILAQNRDASASTIKALMADERKNNRKLQELNKDMRRTAMVSNITSFFAQFLHDSKKFYVELKNYEFALYENLVENASALITKKINIGTQYYTNSLDIVTATMQGNVMQLGSQATNHQISLAKNLWEYQREYGLTLRKTQNKASIAEQNFVIGPQADYLLNTVKNAGVTGINMRNEQQRYNNVKNGVYDFEMSDDAKKQLNEWVKFTEQEKDEVKSLIELRQKALDLDVDQQEKLFKFQEQIYEQAEQIYQRVQNIADETQKNLSEIDKGSKEFAKQFGFVGAQGQAWTNTMIDNNVIATKWAMKAEDFLRAQESYFDNSGRGVNLNQAGGEDFNQMAALSRATGMDMGQIGALMGDMNIFNTSVEHGVDNMGTMYRLANKMGLSGRKFMKDLSQNLKLAQKYNFVGGTKAMEKMSVWSQQVRLNLQSVANFAEGIMDGGLESTLEKAAKLQVLGGNAAIYSDPLGMMYDAGADVGNLARRIEGMIGNYGTFNSKTGETTFSWTDDMMVRQIAKGLGIDPEEAKNVLREKNKFSVARKQIDKSIFNEEEQREISNRATYDEKTGQFQVTMLDGTKRDINKLRKEDLDLIRSDNDTEALTQYAEKSLTVEQSIFAKTEYIAARIAQITGDAWYAAKERQKQIIQSHTGEQIDIGSSKNAETWDFQNRNLDQDYAQVYRNFTDGTYNEALKTMKTFTAAAAIEVGKFGGELREVNKLIENNDLDKMLELFGGFAEETGSKNLKRVANKATVNYGRSKDGKHHWDSHMAGLMGGFWTTDADERQYGGKTKWSVEPTKFTAAHGYTDERAWVVQENNTSAVTSLTQAINSLSSVQIKSNADVKLNGSINLNGTNLKIDADQLARDPQFMQELVSLISNRIELNRNGGKSNGAQPGVVRK